MRYCTKTIYNYCRYLNYSDSAWPLITRDTNNKKVHICDEYVLSQKLRGIL